MEDDDNTASTFTINDDKSVVRDLADEDVEDQVHDQLPSVEEAKANLEHKPIGGNSYLKSTICAGVVFVILVVGVTLLAVLVPQSGSSSSSESAPSIPAFPKTSREEDIIQLLLHNEITPEATLRDRNSAQARAAQFIADGDSYQLAVTEGNIRGFMERYVLATLYYHFNGDDWTYQLNFMKPQDHCTWFTRFQTTAGNIYREGVICNGDGHVTQLMLAYNNLEGDGFPDEIRWLEKLDVFNMHFNPNIIGKFPRGLQFLTKLKGIGLHYNSLSGVIPEWIGDLTDLRTLTLGDNMFEGDVPASMSRLSNLKFLALDDNQGLTGNVQLFNTMTQLELLYLEDNAFDGNIDGMLEAMPNLVEFDISNNMMDGEIPLALFNHKALSIVDMHNNEFAGEIPNDISENPNLEFLSLYKNLLTGDIPERIRHLEDVLHLDLSFNKLIGTPDNLGTLTQLQYLQISGNNFTSNSLQDIDFSQLTSLRELAMKDNNLKGALPDWLGEFTDLRTLDLDANQLTGAIPSWIGNLQGLDHLLLNRNNLDGTLPLAMGTLKDLDVLLLDGNSFSGTADIVCSNVKPQYFISDCEPAVVNETAEFTCECCTRCCVDGDTECNNLAWTSNLDPIWEYGHNRASYVFSGANAPVEYSKFPDVSGPGGPGALDPDPTVDPAATVAPDPTVDPAATVAPGAVRP